MCVLGGERSLLIYVGGTEVPLLVCVGGRDGPLAARGKVSSWRPQGYHNILTQDKHNYFMLNTRICPRGENIIKGRRGGEDGGEDREGERKARV